MDQEPKRRITKKWLILGLLVVVVALPVSYHAFRRDIYTDPRPEDVPVFLRNIKREIFGEGSRPPPFLIEAADFVGMESDLEKYYRKRNRTYRRRSERALKILGESAVPNLLALFKDEDSKVGWAAAYSLGVIGPDAKDAVPDLIADLEDKIKNLDDRHLGAIKALEKIGPSAKGSAPVLVKILNEEKHFFKWGAADALGVIDPNTEIAVPALIEALDDKWHAARAASAYALGRIGPEASAAVPELLETLVRENAREDMTGIGGEPYSSVRDAVIHALMRVGADIRIAVPPLIEALDTVPNSTDVARCLGKIGPAAKDAVPALIEASKSEDAMLRLWSNYALVKIDVANEKECLAYLIEALDDDENPTDAARCLGEIGPAAMDAVPALVEASKSEDATLRVWSNYALVKIGVANEKECLNCLIKALDDEDSVVRIRAAEALKRIDLKAAYKAGVE